MTNYTTTDEQIIEMWQIQTTEYYPAVKKKKSKEIMTFVSKLVKIKQISLNEVAQTQTDKCYMIFII